MTVNHSNLSVMSRLLGYKVVEDTKNNRLKNDCSSQCDGTHCDVCQFGTDYSKVIQTKLLMLSRQRHTVEIFINPKQVSMVKVNPNRYKRPEP